MKLIGFWAFRMIYKLLSAMGQRENPQLCSYLQIAHAPISKPLPTHAPESHSGTSIGPLSHMPFDWLISAPYIFEEQK